jgi:hypothetical protein
MDDYEGGFFAFYSGKLRTANPYDAMAQSVVFDRWECGWLDAEEMHGEALAQLPIDPQIAE